MIGVENLLPLPQVSFPIDFKEIISYLARDAGPKDPAGSGSTASTTHRPPRPEPDAPTSSTARITAPTPLTDSNTLATPSTKHVGLPARNGQSNLRKFGTSAVPKAHSSSSNTTARPPGSTAGAALDTLVHAPPPAFASGFTNLDNSVSYPSDLQFNTTTAPPIGGDSPSRTSPPTQTTPSAQSHSPNSDDGSSVYLTASQGSSPDSTSGVSWTSSELAEISAASTQAEAAYQVSLNATPASPQDGSDESEGESTSNRSSSSSDVTMNSA